MMVMVMVMELELELDVGAELVPRRGAVGGYWRIRSQGSIFQFDLSKQFVRR